ncbi:putative pyridoxal phosphate-dependent aminotransferase EpsN [Lachnospiraceae bacterium]|nr:putative pyridoxal phosphate-dependent aminotransferase EpsN [Lachnospiraceae bacterium]
MSIKPFKNKIWLASPTMHGDEQECVKEAFDTNWVSTVGKNLEQLERGICDYVGCAHGVALSAGTAALHLAVKLAEIKRGDKVMCSDLTFAATVNPVSYEQGVQVFIDSEQETWNMDPKALERAFQKYPDTKAVIAANLYGTPAQLSEIQELCRKYGAVFIEDAAESLGAVYKGRQTGTFGTYGVISFNGNKIITTSGGGMLLTDNGEAANKARFWSTQARENVPWYQHKELGYNYRMSNILAGIGRGQLRHLEEHRIRKKEIYDRYQRSLRGLPLTMNPFLEYTEPNFWLSCILLDEGTKVTPHEIREKLEKYHVEARPIWKPMHLQPIYEKNDFISAVEGADVGKDIFRRGLCLPSDIKMTEEEQEIVIELIKSCF